MTLPLRYEDFLAAKVAMAPVSGFIVEDHEINPLLKPHQKASVKWACMGGRRALFLAFGLGKTFVQIEVLRLVQEKFGNGAGMALIAAPLGVRREFFRDVRTLATGDHPDITDAQRAALRAWQAGRPDRVPALKFMLSEWSPLGEFDAWYLNGYLLHYEDGCGDCPLNGAPSRKRCRQESEGGGVGCPTTGFHAEADHPDYEHYFLEARVVGWRLL